MPALVAEGLVRAYAGMRVLAGVDLTVEAGETLALLGPNGAGKTTLLRVFALLLRPSEGRLTLFGIDARSAPPELRRRLGYLAHESFCYPDLSPTSSCSTSPSAGSIPRRSRHCRSGSSRSVRPDARSC